MSDDANNYTHNLQISVMRMGLLATCLQDFAVQIMRHVLSGGTLDDDALSEIRQTCITNLKNSAMTGLPIEQEAEIFRDGIDKLNEFIDAAIQRARDNKQ
jgi:hypothetical protein